ncbi:hypothetical protein GCM10010254_69060 [Streptomyces chromofuscus]|nr:hypothetical protein GCM10010254_69060 [Streptomyces chromofuscus]
MTATDAKADLLFYLQSARDALLWKLEGLSEYDIRRPLTPTGTNLLGLVKHVAGVELGYLGDTFGRPSGEPLPWLDEGAETNADMWATADESREFVVDLYRRAWAHADATIDAMALDTVGRVPWWPDGKDEVTLQHAVVRVIADTQRHAGHEGRTTPACRRATRRGGRSTATDWSARPGRPSGERDAGDTRARAAGSDDADATLPGKARAYGSPARARAPRRAAAGVRPPSGPGTQRMVDVDPDGVRWTSSRRAPRAGCPRARRAGRSRR